MTESLKSYLRPQKSATLGKYLYKLRSKPRTRLSIIGLRIWPCDDNYRYRKIDPTFNGDLL
ncbi:hypothetical protein GGR55DRAFT_643965 [Xylaria sp. FL0064]|nr:hypothetical protein GGR55DRAFT_643965 [Xylaria sp. FL0064]